MLWKIDPFHDLSRTFTAMVRDRRICDALASIYGGREPRLFKDKLIYKPPHTHGSTLHQDYLWWQGYIGMRHNAGASISFVDGHARHANDEDMATANSNGSSLMTHWTKDLR